MHELGLDNIYNITCDLWEMPTPSVSYFSYYNSDFTTYSEQYKDFLKQFFLAQIDSFESGMSEETLPCLFYLQPWYPTTHLLICFIIFFILQHIEINYLIFLFDEFKFVINNICCLKLLIIWNWNFKSIFINNRLWQVAVIMFFLAAGWVFWTAKTEDHCAPEWDYLFLLENGIVPADLCNRDTVCWIISNISYRTICFNHLKHTVHAS